ncbi:MAG TPA: tetratricopeptide repeat protein, partial [Solirubrobacteraceae bacterium]|nr:tetratricopeptide repeat protein [Solirubrobacteraceae bacterium]
RRLSPLAALGLVAVLAGVVVAIALASAGDGGRETATSTPRQTQAPRDRSETQAAAPATPPADGESAQTAAPPAGQDPEALNEQGFQLNQAGNYAAAVEPLRASVEGYREAGRRDEIGYAYALYNLGVALNRSGNPEAAIPVLEERLQYNNQRGVVRQELADAQSKLGGDEKKGRGEDKDDD